MNQNENQNLEVEADQLIAQLAQQTQAQVQPAQAAPNHVIADEVMPFAGAKVLSGDTPAPQPSTTSPQGHAPQQPAAMPTQDPNPMLLQQMQQMQGQMQKMGMVIEGLNAAQNAGVNVQAETNQVTSLLDSLKEQLDQIPDEYEDTAQLKAVFLNGFETLANQMQVVQPAQVQAAAPVEDFGVDGHGGQLIAVHPDLFSIVDDSTFQTWAQADAMRNHIRMEGDTAQSINLLAEFKQYKIALAQQQTHGLALQHAQPSHAVAIEPANNGGNMPAQVSADNLHQILNQPNDKHGAKFAESESQIDALLEGLVQQ